MRTYAWKKGDFFIGRRSWSSQIINNEGSITNGLVKELKYTFKFAILVSGFRSKLEPLAHFYRAATSTPSLHVIGDTDRIVEKGTHWMKTMFLHENRSRKPWNE